MLACCNMYSCLKYTSRSIIYGFNGKPLKKRKPVIAIGKPEF
jgi:hypothetical protein